MIYLNWENGAEIYHSAFDQGICFFKYFIYLFVEKGERREKEGEKHECVVASHTPPY